MNYDACRYTQLVLSNYSHSAGLIEFIYWLFVPDTHTQRTKCKRDSRGMMHLEVRDGVRGGQPRRARVLLGAEGAVESLRDCAEVVRANCRGSNAVPASQERE